MGHIAIVGGLTQGGRLNMERLGDPLRHKKLDVAPLLTHRLKGFGEFGKGPLLMKDKPRDLVKPVVTP